MSGHSTGEVLTSVHPTFLYELVWNVLVCLFLLWAHRAWKLGHGRVFALYVMAYTLGRFFVENMRADDATLVFGVRINVIVSVVVFLGAAIAFYLLPRGQETPHDVDWRHQKVYGGIAQPAEAAKKPNR